MQGKYKDIIHHPYHGPVYHPHMSLGNRAAQFSPFAAVSGHGDALKETARLTSERIELTEDQQELLRQQLQFLSERAGLEVAVTHFVADARKSGGEYVTTSGILKKVDSLEQEIVLANGVGISFLDIIEIHFEQENQAGL